MAIGLHLDTIEPGTGRGEQAILRLYLRAGEVSSPGPEYAS